MPDLLMSATPNRVRETGSQLHRVTGAQAVGSMGKSDLVMFTT